MIPGLFEAMQRDVPLAPGAMVLDGLWRSRHFDTWSHLAAIGCRLR